MRDPKQTIAYLDELEALGFTNEAFWRLHHFRDKDRKDTIQSHRRYCEKTESFHEDETNERVQIRLEIVLEYFQQYYADAIRVGRTTAAEVFPPASRCSVHVSPAPDGLIRRAVGPRCLEPNLVLRLSVSRKECA